MFQFNAFTTLTLVVVSVVCLAATSKSYACCQQGLSSDQSASSMIRRTQPYLEYEPERKGLGRFLAGRYVRSMPEYVSSSNNNFDREDNYLGFERANLRKRRSSSEALAADQENNSKVALKKRWHKMVDDLIDGAFVGNQQDKEMSKLKQIAADSSYKKKKWQTPQALSSNSNSNSDKGFEKIMILVKKPSSEEVNDNNSQVDDQQNLNSVNVISKQWDSPATLATGSSLQYPQRNSNINSNEQHMRRVLDDKFGIMKESIFTTNNQLGHKGVPKFGSEEEYWI